MATYAKRRHNEYDLMLSLTPFQLTEHAGWLDGDMRELEGDLERELRREKDRNSCAKTMWKRKHESGNAFEHCVLGFAKPV